MVDITKIDAFVQSSPHPVWLATTAGNCIYANPAVERLTGLNSDQINQADWRSFLLEEDRAAAMASWQRSFATGTPYRTRVRMRAFNGVPATIELIAVGQKVGEGTELWLFSGLQVDGATQQHAPLEAQLQATLNVIPAYTWYASPCGALTFVNERTADYLGLPKHHPLRLGIDIGAEWDSHIAFLHPDDHEETRRVWSTCLRTSCAGEVSFRVRNAEGAYRWFLSRAEPIRASDGTLLHWIGVNLEIEERKQAEFYLAEGQRLAHTGSWVFNPAGFDYWSPELFRIHGLTPGKQAPTLEEYLALVHPEDREFMASLVKRVVEEASGFDVTKRIIRPNGEVGYIRCVGTPVVEDGTLKRFIGTGVDVTENEVLTQALRKSEAYLAEAQRLSKTGSWAWNPASDNTYYSEECYRVLGFEPHGPPPPLETVIQRIHPDDQAYCRERLEKAIRDKVDFELDYRIVYPDKRVRDIHCVCHAVLDQSGDLVELVGTVIDITERKRAEQELQQLVDLVPQGIVVLDPDGKLIHANRFAREYAGLPPEEFRPLGLIGRISHPDDVGRALAARERGLAGGEPFELDARLLGADGVYRWFLFRFNPLVEQGRVKRWYATATEIESRKQEEERVRKENVRLEERTRIAQELHDTLLQTFQSALLHLGAVQYSVAQDSPVKPRLDRILQMMRQGIAEGRDAIQGLRSSGSQTSDLVVGLSRIQQELDVQADIDFRVTVTGRPKQLPSEIQDEIYRIGREALVNAFCHSGARSVELELKYSEDDLRMRIRDDGRGIDPQVLEKGRDGHWGIAGMRERATRIGGLVKILSGPTAGTEVQLSIPTDIALRKIAAQ